MKNLIFLSFLGILLTLQINGEEITPLAEEDTVSPITSIVSKSDSFMVAFGMDSSSLTVDVSTRNPSISTVATQTATHLSHQGIQPPFTPYNITE